MDNQEDLNKSDRCSREATDIFKLQGSVILRLTLSVAVAWLLTTQGAAKANVALHPPILIAALLVLSPILFLLSSSPWQTSSELRQLPVGNFKEVSWRFIVPPALAAFFVLSSPGQWVEFAHHNGGIRPDELATFESILCFVWGGAKFACLAMAAFVLIRAMRSRRPANFIAGAFFLLAGFLI